MIAHLLFDTTLRCLPSNSNSNSTRLARHHAPLAPGEKPAGRLDAKSRMHRGSAEARSHFHLRQDA